MTTKKEFDYKKPFQTRDGRKAELLADGLSGDYCLCVKITDEDGHIHTRTYTKKGIYSIVFTPNPKDLINIPQKITKWFNVYSNNIYMHNTKEEADTQALQCRTACIKIEFEEGEGLENENWKRI